MPGSGDRHLISLIRSRSLHGRHEDALLLFRRLQHRRRRPNTFLLPTVLRSCAILSDLDYGRSLHGLVVRSVLDSDAFVGAALVRMYSRCGRPGLARRVFDGMPQRDLAAWNSMISGYAHLGLAGDAMTLFEEMHSSGLKPDLLTWNSLVSGFSFAGNFPAVFGLFSRMRLAGVSPDVFSWTSVVSGLVRSSRCYEAIRVFMRMVAAEGVMPSPVSICSVLPACAAVADLRRGREIHALSMVIGAGGDEHVGGSLLDMYAKCGLLRDAEKVFDKMTRRSIVTWNSMIFGYANHGGFGRAAELFRRMEEEGVLPDHLTFTGLLNACSVAGAVEAGKGFYGLMKHGYGMEPRMEHYACMVDLLGRAGELGEARDFVGEMPVEPDCFVWGALLGACRKHGDVELARVAAASLRELEPRSPGSCSTLNNVLASAGRWGEAVGLKKLMRRKKMQRYLGCSWMQSC